MRNDVIVNRNFADLNPLLLGEEDCHPSHSFGPAVRKYTLIHFVTRGKGIVYKQEGSYSVGAGEAFLILPDEVVTYTADVEDPWSYQWIGFDGGLSERFTRLPTVFKLSSAYVQAMLDTDGSDLREYRIAAVLFEMYAALFGEKRAATHDYVRRVKDYIRAVYMQDVYVEEIAKSMHLNRRYLSRFFKEKTGMTVQEYLSHVRMEEAKRLLLLGKSVNETSVLCGYHDPFHFSKMFKRRLGVSPGAWRIGQKADS